MIFQISIPKQKTGEQTGFPAQPPSVENKLNGGGQKKEPASSSKLVVKLMMQENVMVNFGDGNWQNIRVGGVWPAVQEKIASADPKLQLGFQMHKESVYYMVSFFAGNQIAAAELGEAGTMSLTLVPGTKPPETINAAAYNAMLRDQERLARESIARAKKKKK
jgi:hypothetical protein